MSKKLIGNLFILTATSFLNLYVNFCATLVIVKPCIYPKKVLIAYKPKSVSKIPRTLLKSIPVPPDIFPTIPLNISVVAFPKILGPTIVKTVLPTANINIINNCHL